MPPFLNSGGISEADYVESETNSTPVSPYTPVRVVYGVEDVSARIEKLFAEDGITGKVYYQRYTKTSVTFESVDPVDSSGKLTVPPAVLPFIVVPDGEQGSSYLEALALNLISNYALHYGVQELDIYEAIDADALAWWRKRLPAPVNAEVIHPIFWDDLEHRLETHTVLKAARNLETKGITEFIEESCNFRIKVRRSVDMLS